MRWDALFGDMQAQWDGHQQEAFASEVAEALELERSRIQLADRLRVQSGQQMRLQLRGARSMTLMLGEVGSDWLSAVSGGRGVLIPLGALEAVYGISPVAQAETSTAQRRLGIGSALRALARRREQVLAHGVDGELASGTLVGVGQDHIDILQPGGRRVTVALQALVMLLSRTPDS